MLLKAMQQYKGSKTLTLYWDIETLAYNKIEGRKKPTQYKNVTYSVAIGWNDNGKINVEVFPNFKTFFNKFLEYANRRDTITKSGTSIQMIAHNCNKYDNHFLEHDLLHDFDFKVENLFMKSAENNEETINMKEAKMSARDENIILEKRVKSSVNLDMTFFFEGFKFTVVDNFMKTMSSIATLGKKLKDSGYLTDDQLKTDFEYDIFDVETDMTYTQAQDYALKCFDRLTDEQLTYIHNDVIILGQSHIHYSDLFPNFDYSAMTFSVNILRSYLNNTTTSYQLLNKFGKDSTPLSEFSFGGLNYYDYVKGFYKGGLNMYNPKFINTIIDEDCFSIDINSSYPYVMYHEKIPTFINSYGEYDTEQTITTNLKNRNKWSLYKMSKQTFNVDILMKIKSEMVKKILVKYYNTVMDHDKHVVNINTNTLRMIEGLTGIKLNKIKVMSYVTYDCIYFGARDKIHDYYYIKTQGKMDKKIIMDTPYDYTITDEKNDILFSDEEILLAKTNLNGLYGIPALRSHFNLFRRDTEGELFNIINGYKNTERNLLFSTFVTSQSIYNLLEPLQSLSQQEIDDNFIYCDTDSLYLKSKIKHKIDPNIFDPISLGKWDIENERIVKMFVLNHKKYAYLKPNGKIKVASAGIPLSAFNTNQSFEDFIANDFHHGKVVYNNKSIYNDQRTITIYPSKTNIEKGNDYPSFFTYELEDEKNSILDEIRENYDPQDYTDILYIESYIGTFSINDLHPVTNDKEKTNLKILKLIHDEIKKSDLLK